MCASSNLISPADTLNESNGPSPTYPEQINVLFFHLLLIPALPIHPIYHLASFLPWNSLRMLTIFSKLVSQASSSLLTRA
jgi:hypothetical protein